MTIEIQPGWHAYASTAAGSANTALELSLELPEGMTQRGDWQRPQGHADPLTPDAIVLEGSLTYRCVVRGSPKGDERELGCLLSYQVCDAESCNRPTSEELRAAID